MRNVLYKGKLKSIRAVWDDQVKQNNTYFPKWLKEKIVKYFSQKLVAPVLDVGGGSYIYHPDSYVIDVSLLALGKNPLPKERKQVFNLDDIISTEEITSTAEFGVIEKEGYLMMQEDAESGFEAPQAQKKSGKKLPFSNNFFGSAIMVSVYQYLQNPFAVVNEIRRVVKPRGSLYIVTYYLQGLGECALREEAPFETAQKLAKRGYTIKREIIPLQTENDNVVFGSTNLQIVQVIFDKQTKQ